MTDRDVQRCGICGKLGSGVRHPKVFIGDCCSSQMLPETVGEIAVMWE